MTRTLLSEVVDGSDETVDVSGLEFVLVETVGGSGSDGIGSRSGDGGSGGATARYLDVSDIDTLRNIAGEDVEDERLGPSNDFGSSGTGGTGHANGGAGGTASGVRDDDTGDALLVGAGGGGGGGGGGDADDDEDGGGGGGGGVAEGIGGDGGSTEFGTGGDSGSDGSDGDPITGVPDIGGDGGDGGQGHSIPNNRNGSNGQDGGTWVNSSYDLGSTSISDSSNAASRVYEVDPDAPENFSATKNESDEAELSWDAVDDVDGYRVYRSRTAGVTTDDELLADVLATSYTDADPYSGSNYYAVTSYVESSEEVWQSDTSGEDSISISIEPVENITLENVDGRHATISWEEPNDDIESYDVYVREVGETDWTLDGDAPGVDAGETQTYETTELLDGQQYDVRVRNIAGDESETAAENGLFTTDLPDVDGFVLDASTQDELGVEEITPHINNGEYRIRWRRAADDEFDADDETTVPYDADPLEYVIEGVLDGAKYDVAIRSETDDATGSWHEASAITKLVPASNITLEWIDNSVPDWQSDIDVSWTVESDFEGSQQIRLQEFDEDGEIVETVDVETESTTLEAELFDPGRDYEVTIRAQTDYVYADGGTEWTADFDGLQAAIYAEIDDPRRDDPIPIDPPKAIRNATIRHSATSDVDIETADLGPELRDLGELNPNVDLRARMIDQSGEQIRDDRILKGILGEIETEGQSAEALLKCKGRGWFLDRDVPESPYQISNTLVWEAVEEYAADELDGWDVDVTPDPGSPVVTDEVGQAAETREEWEDLLEDVLEDDDPVEITDDGVTTYETCDPRDALNDNDFGAPGFESGDEYNDGQAAFFSSEDDYVEFVIEWPYHLPAEHVGIKVRDGDVGTNDGEIRFLWDGTEFDRHDAEILFNWAEMGSEGYNTGGYQDEIGADLEASESHRLKIEAVDSTSIVVDAIAVYDQRFEYNFHDPGEELEGGYLDGPEPKPNAYHVHPPEIDRESQVERAEITSHWDDTSNEQALAASNTGGDQYIGESNTETLEVNFSEEEQYGTDLQTRLTISRYPTDEPRNAFPRFGYNAQTIESYELRFDQTSVAVIDELALSDSHKENLTTLCDRGRLNWVIDHVADDRALEVFPIGVEGPDVDWTAADWSRTDGSFDYANRILVRGARKDEEDQEHDDDLRYEAVAEDEDEIERRKEMGLDESKAVVTRTILDPELDSDEEVQQQAFNTLEELVEESLATGSIDVVPTFIKPGYSYPVPEWNSDDDDPPTKVLEQVSVSQEYGSASGQLQFEAPQNWVRAVDPLERDVGGLKRLF